MLYDARVSREPIWGFRSVFSSLHRKNKILKWRLLQNVSVAKFTLPDKDVI
jgi:hypothetical protein